MVYYYAQINSENVTAGVSQLSGPVTSENMIPITEEQYNTGSVLNCRYDVANNSWIPLPPPPEPPQPIPVTGL